MRIFLKSLIVTKNEEGGPFEIFQHPFLLQNIKKMKGDPLEAF